MTEISTKLGGYFRDLGFWGEVKIRWGGSGRGAVENPLPGSRPHIPPPGGELSIKCTVTVRVWTRGVTES